MEERAGRRRRRSEGGEGERKIGRREEGRGGKGGEGETGQTYMEEQKRVREGGERRGKRSRDGKRWRER